MDTHSLLKPIHNKLGEYDTAQLVTLLSVKLHGIEKGSFADAHLGLPWELLLLIKWSYEYGGLKYPPKPPSEQVIVQLLNRLREIEGELQASYLNNGGTVGLSKFLRTLAFQQFRYQQSFGSWILARSYSLFCELPIDHPLQIAFADATGISMVDFLELGFLSWTWLQNFPDSIYYKPNEVFGSSRIDPEVVKLYLKVVSLEFEDVKNFLRDRPHTVRNPGLQLIEPTPFVRFPIVLLSNQYLVYSRRLFELMLGDLFYDIIKNMGVAGLSEQFGSIFEKYVRQALVACKFRMFDEAELSAKLHGNKVTDFVLSFNECTVLIEVKSVELRPSVKVYPETKTLVRELQDSVIKGTLQGLSVAQKLKTSAEGLDISNREKFYLIIITYRDLYLGSGEDVWKEFLGSAVGSACKNLDIDTNMIPPSNIVIMSIEEFDPLVSILLDKRSTLPSILDEMVKSNSDPRTKKLSFWQHYAHLVKKSPKLQYLDEPLARFYDRVETKLLS